MNSPSSKSKQHPVRRWIGGFCLLLCVVTLLAGCSAQTQHKWLTVFFDGVPPLGGATNAPALANAARPTITNAPVQSPTVPLRPKEIMHPPFAERNCTACHESQFSQNMRGKPGEACFNCHQEFQKNF